MKISMRQFRNVIWEELDKDDKSKKKKAEKGVRIMPIGKEDDETTSKYVSGKHELNPDKMDESQKKKLREGNPEADKAAYDKIMAMITSTLKDPMATKKIGNELAGAMHITMQSVAQKGGAPQAPGQQGQSLSMKSIARESDEMDESDAGYSGWLPETVQFLDEVVSRLQSVDAKDPKLAETIEKLYIDVHDVSLRCEGLIKEFAAQNKEDEFVLQLIHNFPIKPGFDPKAAVMWVKNVLRKFGAAAMDLVTDPAVWQQKIATHDKSLPPEDVKKLTAVILRALGA